MKRSDVDIVKVECTRLLARISELERCAGWSRYESFADGTVKDCATKQPHPNDIFDGGHYVSAVKRARLDLRRVLTKISM